MAHEVFIWSRCNHPNILKFTGVTQYQGQIAIVSHPGGKKNLGLYLPLASDVNLCAVCAQIADGIAYMHDEQLVHGDIRAIAEFGNSWNEGLGNSDIPFDPNVSRRWMAPEALMSMGSWKRTSQTDVYSLGMTILEILTRAIPYNELSDTMAMISALNGVAPLRPEVHIPIRSHQGDLLWALLLSCWVHNPRDRPKALHIRDTMIAISNAGLLKVTQPRVTDATPITEVLKHLVDNDCADKTHELDMKVDLTPIARTNRYNNIYRGWLYNGSQVGVKCRGLQVCNNPIKRSLFDLVSVQTSSGG
ncbi:kinase-like domain-containing protein [Rhizoctonia solani]|nr:kinase-like domain-containing protein [Rhizoctonia solani]